MGESWVSTEELESGIYLLRIEREKALNALNPIVLEQLGEALTRLEEDASVRVVIVTGQGSKAFVAGADIGAISQVSDRHRAQMFAEMGQRLFTRFRHSRLIFFAAINGYALGGGLELAMALDFRVAAESARLGQPEINLGIIPGFGGTQRLGQLVGVSEALWLIASGEPIEASTAKALGLVNEVVAGEQLIEECLKRARILVGKPPLALEECKRLVYGNLTWHEAEGLEEEARSFSRLAVSDDGRAGTQAFLQHRKPVFRGS